jgi:hypothetical protein
VLHPGNRSVILDLDSNGEIVAIYIRGDVHVVGTGILDRIRREGAEAGIGMQIGRIVKTRNLSTRQDESANGLGQPESLTQKLQRGSPGLNPVLLATGYSLI